MTTLRIHTLLASNLALLLRALTVLAVDWERYPKSAMPKEYQKLLPPEALKWHDLPGLTTAIKSAKSGINKLETLYNLGLEIKAAAPLFKKRFEYSYNELNLLSVLGNYFRTDNPKAMEKIRRLAGGLGDPQLAKIVLEPKAVGKVNHSELHDKVMDLVGRKDTALTLPEAQLLKETSPDEYDEYAELRKAHTKSAKEELLYFVRNSGKSKVPYSDAYDYLKSKGYNKILVPGFVGLIDDQGRIYTKDGEAIPTTPTPAVYEKIVMNTHMSEEEGWIAKAIKPDGKQSYLYTENHRKEQNQEKYERVQDLGAKIKSIRNKWLTQVKAFSDEKPLTVAATVLEILYEFAARIGGKPGRGPSMLFVSQIKGDENGMVIRYLGKDSVKTVHKLVPSDPIQRLVIRNLMILMEGKANNDFVFTYKKGNRLVRLLPADVNRAFHMFGAPAGVTVHKIRTIKGTTLFEQLAEAQLKKRPPKSEQEAISIYKNLTEQVGKLLNHVRGVGSSNKVTGTTAATSYIDTAAQLALFNAWGIRPPKSLEKLLITDDN